MIRFEPQAVLFDCAGTLLDVRWSPERFVTVCAERQNQSLTPAMAASFGEMFYLRRTEYEAASRTRRAPAMRAFWVDLLAAWLERHGFDPVTAEGFVATAEAISQDPDGVWFAPFPDVRPCLERLRNAGLRLAIISNWDSSLHRILAAQGLTRYFDAVVASLEEGMEKPDPRLFHLALRRLDVGSSEVVHVGDDPTDDLAGARRAGLRALLIDREGAAHSPAGLIRSLDELPEAFEWSV